MGITRQCCDCLNLEYYNVGQRVKSKYSASQPMFPKSRYRDSQYFIREVAHCLPRSESERSEEIVDPMLSIRIRSIS